MKKILIFGGTTEGRKLSYLLSDWGIPVAVSVATEYGREAQGEKSGIKVYVGRRNCAEMAALLRDNVLICVDATHPYAAEATRNIQTACAESGVMYRRLSRPAVWRDSDMDIKNLDFIKIFSNTREAARYLSENTRDERILLTIGAKELRIFSEFENLNPIRLYPRILPTHEGLDVCEAVKIPRENIIAMRGPFSTAFNQALIRQFEIQYLVTKDGGKIGGFPEKIEAARNTGIKLILIRRPAEPAENYNFDTIAAYCRALFAENAYKYY